MQRSKFDIPYIEIMHDLARQNDNEKIKIVEGDNKQIIMVNEDILLELELMKDRRMNIRVSEPYLRRL